MSSLAVRLQDRIKKSGPIPLATFMKEALYDPKEGYYISQSPIGKGGDFVTSPEISQLFGEMIGLWLAYQWEDLGSPKEAALVECGPGKGTLFDDILHATRYVPGFHEAMSLHLVETSPVLQKVQQEKLRSYPCHWHQSMDTLPKDVPIFLVANEFLDAFPIEQYLYQDGMWVERYVTAKDGAFHFTELPISDKMEAFLTSHYPHIHSDAVIETSLAIKGWIIECAKRLESQGGHACFIDYGYDIPWSERTTFSSTLQAVKSHEYHDVLEDIGQVDLTSHVDFYAIKHYCKHVPDIQVEGAWTQGSFLNGLHIGVRAQQLAHHATDATMIHDALKRLVSPDQMGTLFKVLTMTRRWG